MSGTCVLICLLQLMSTTDLTNAFLFSKEQHRRARPYTPGESDVTSGIRKPSEVFASPNYGRESRYYNQLRENIRKNTPIKEQQSSIQGMTFKEYRAYKKEGKLPRWWKPWDMPPTEEVEADTPPESSSAGQMGSFSKVEDENVKLDGREATEKEEHAEFEKRMAGGDRKDDLQKEEERPGEETGDETEQQKTIHIKMDKRHRLKIARCENNYKQDRPEAPERVKQCSFDGISIPEQQTAGQQSGLESDPHSSPVSDPEPSPQSSPQSSPQLSVESSPHSSPESRPQSNSQSSLESSPHSSPESSPHSSPESSPQSSVPSTPTTHKIEDAESTGPGKVCILNPENADATSPDQFCWLCSASFWYNSYTLTATIVCLVNSVLVIWYKCGRTSSNTSGTNIPSGIIHQSSQTPVHKFKPSAARLDTDQDRAASPHSLSRPGVSSHEARPHSSSYPLTPGLSPSQRSSTRHQAEVSETSQTVVLPRSQNSVLEPGLLSATSTVRTKATPRPPVVNTLLNSTSIGERDSEDRKARHTAAGQKGERTRQLSGGSSTVRDEEAKPKPARAIIDGRESGDRNLEPPSSADRNSQRKTENEVCEIYGNGDKASLSKPDERPAMGSLDYAERTHPSNRNLVKGEGDNRPGGSQEAMIKRTSRTEVGREACKGEPASNTAAVQVSLHGESAVANTQTSLSLGGSIGKSQNSIGRQNFGIAATQTSFLQELEVTGKKGKEPGGENPPRQEILVACTQTSLSMDTSLAVPRRMSRHSDGEIPEKLNSQRQNLAGKNSLPPHPPLSTTQAAAGDSSGRARLRSVSPTLLGIPAGKYTSRLAAGTQQHQQQTQHNHQLKHIDMELENQQQKTIERENQKPIELDQEKRYKQEQQNKPLLTLQPSLDAAPLSQPPALRQQQEENLHKPYGQQRPRDQQQYHGHAQPHGQQPARDQCLPNDRHQHHDKNQPQNQRLPNDRHQHHDKNQPQNQRLPNYRHQYHDKDQLHDQRQPIDRPQHHDKNQPHDQRQPNDRHQNHNEKQPQNQRLPNDRHQHHDKNKPHDQREPNDRHQNQDKNQPHDQRLANDRHQSYDKHQLHDRHRPLGQQPRPHDARQAKDQNQPHGQQQPNDQHKLHGQQRSQDQQQPHDERQVHVQQPDYDQGRTRDRHQPHSKYLPHDQHPSRDQHEPHYRLHDPPKPRDHQKPHNLHHPHSQEYYHKQHHQLLPKDSEVKAPPWHHTLHKLPISGEDSHHYHEFKSGSIRRFPAEAGHNDFLMFCKGRSASQKNSRVHSRNRVKDVCTGDCRLDIETRLPQEHNPTHAQEHKSRPLILKQSSGRLLDRRLLKSNSGIDCDPTQARNLGATNQSPEPPVKHAHEHKNRPEELKLSSGRLADSKFVKSSPDHATRKVMPRPPSGYFLRSDISNLDSSLESFQSIQSDERNLGLLDLKKRSSIYHPRVAPRSYETDFSSKSLKTRNLVKQQKKFLKDSLQLSQSPRKSHSVTKSEKEFSLGRNEFLKLYPKRSLHKDSEEKNILYSLDNSLPYYNTKTIGEKIGVQNVNKYSSIDGRRGGEKKTKDFPSGIRSALPPESLKSFDGYMKEYYNLQNRSHNQASNRAPSPSRLWQTQCRSRNVDNNESNNRHQQRASQKHDQHCSPRVHGTNSQPNLIPSLVPSTRHATARGTVYVPALRSPLQSHRYVNVNKNAELSEPTRGTSPRPQTESAHSLQETDQSTQVGDVDV